MTDQIQQPTMTPTPQVAPMQTPPQGQAIPYPPYQQQPGQVPMPQVPVIQTPTQPERKTWGQLFWKKFNLWIKWFVGLIIFRFVGKFIVDIFFNVGFRIDRIIAGILSIWGIVIGIWFVIIVFKRVMGAEETTTENTTYVIVPPTSGVTPPYPNTLTPEQQTLQNPYPYIPTQPEQPVPSPQPVPTIQQ